MISWNYMLLLAGTLLVFLWYKEWKGKNRPHLYGRLAASLLAVTSLLFMAYPYAEKNNAAVLKKIILLTDGFIKDSLAHFLQQSNTPIPVFTAIPVHMNIPAANAVQLVTNWTLFARGHAADTIHVFGNGLNRETLALLQSHPIVFHGGPATPAISHIYWKQLVQTGEPLTVQGHYENSADQKIKIMLQAFGAVMDTVFIAAGASRDFSLQTVPLHTGRAVYSLIVVAGNDTLEKEPVPVEVQTAATLQLLIISSSPDFENTFLKNHLSQQGYQVTVATTISSNKTNRQFLNMPVQQQAGRLRIPYLNKFDVLLADEEALQKISPDERDAIQTVVKEKGTGLVIKMDAQKKPGAWYNRFFPVKTLPRGKALFLQLRGAVTDSNRYKIKMTDPVSIEYVPGMQIILQDGQSNIYASGIAYGSGKITATTLQNTYSMALAGDKALYRQLWWLLLSKAARKVYPQEIWQTNPFIPFVNNPLQLQAEENEVMMPETIVEKTRVYLRQDALLPFQWQGMYWPAASGWQTLPPTGIPAGAWYVYKTGDWKQLTAHVHTADTRRYAALHPVSFESAANHRAGISSVNRPLLMLIIFLGSCIFLWVEQKTG